MQIDRADLERHYASLSDEALLAMKPEELVEVAQQCHAAEVESRGLAMVKRARRPKSEPLPGQADLAPADEEASLGDSISPDSSALVTLHTFFDAGDAGEARHALETAGIEGEIEGVSEKSQGGYVVTRFLLRVARIHKERGAAVLAQHVFNPVHEETYRKFFASLDDEELGNLDLSTFVAESKGNHDLIDRVRDSYLDELDHRGLPHPEMQGPQGELDDWAEVGSALSRPEAKLAETVLEEAGISFRSEIEADEAIAGVRILVPAVDFDAACQALEEGMTDEALAALREDDENAK